MTLTLIAALDEDGAIGQTGGGLPWHLPDESAHFRARCAGGWLLVGRRTFDEMQAWFQPTHHVIVLTRNPLPLLPAAHLPGTLIPSPTPTSAISHALHAGATELIVIGGARTYADTLPLAQRLVLSRIGLHSGGSIAFPHVDWTQWTLRHTSPRLRDSSTGTTFFIESWERLQAIRH